jgi:asparagine synthase (glutamine-hydrolysing)
MIGAVSHRGPDGVGFHTDREVGLAHARLSIIDLAGGAQPIHNEDGTVFVVFNGEIFNYVELRQELVARGHVFYTRSDTEVIVHAYEDDGLDFPRRLNGQFAIALWDAARRRLVLARDRVGIRPVFYTEAGGRLAFASEVKALFALPTAERRLDLTALGEVFTFWTPLEPRTLFEGVRTLPPGHVMSVDAADGRTTLRRYWDWSFPRGAPSPERSADDYAEELRALLIDSVRLQLRSDVPVGAYLSGGLDSSIITALIKHYTSSPLKTFSLSFDDPEFDESAYQRELAAHLDTRYTEVRCGRSDIRDAFPRTVRHAESVLLRTAPTPLMLLADRVRAEGYKVVLTGEGADEVFGGYDLFKEARIRRFWARQPGSKVRPLLLDRLYPYLKTSPIAARAFAQGFFREGFDRVDAPYFGHIPRWSTTRRSWELFSEDVAAHLQGYDPYAAVESVLPAEIGGWLPLNRDQYVEAHTLLSGYLLSSQGDRMAMAASIEARFPFLDHRVIEFGSRLPVRYKIMGLQEKYLLKRAVKHMLPRSVWERTKQPYRAPDSRSFFEDGEPADYVADLFSPSRVKAAGYFDPAAVGRLFEKCRRGRAIGFADNTAFVGVLSTMLLHDLFLRPPPPLRDGALDSITTTA